MRTRRQARRELQDSSSPSPPRRKNKKVRGQKEDSKAKDVKKPSKRVKKQRELSPSLSPVKPKSKRGRPKKQPRVQQKSEEKTKSNEKENHSHDKQKQNAKNQQRKEKQRSPSPEKNQAKKKSPQKQEIKRVLVKGAAPVDEHFDKGKDYHVLVHNGKVYSATLNQTNISHNNNKFYNLQILQSDKNSGINYFMTRWGRVGKAGQKSILGPYTINVAIAEYESKFREKHVNGEYRELEMNYGEDQQEEPAQSNQVSNIEKNPLSDYQESKLPKQVKDLITLIFDIGMMNKQMKQIGYNVSKMPLGKLSRQNIKKGYKILEQLYEEIKTKRREAVVEQLTNEFYSYIPHDVGFSNMRLYKLDTQTKVKQKLEMLESLAEIKIATDIINQKEEGNTIDNNFKKLNREIKPIDKDSFTFKLINEYLQTTHGQTHTSYELELVNLFEVDSERERQRYTKDIPNKMLLWHGSRLTNFVGILSQGLRIAPPEAPVTGYMFGKGVYFADMSSKSANYCFTTPENNTGILILCEVALGNCNEKMHADYLASNLPDGKHSTKGVGKNAPRPENYRSLDGVIIPMGPGHLDKNMASSLIYNEFIVYSVEQIKIRYLLRTKFNYRKPRAFT